jgi:hypothetical protein
VKSYLVSYRVTCPKKSHLAFPRLLLSELPRGVHTHGDDTSTRIACQQKIFFLLRNAMHVTVNGHTYRLGLSYRMVPPHRRKILIPVPSQ